MNFSDVLFPRQLEVDGTAEAIRLVLQSRMTKLWSGGRLEVPLVTAGDLLKEALRRARLQGQLRYGLEAISDKLDKEETGIANVRDHKNIPQGERVSRLLLFSSDGAQRFYRGIESLLLKHSSRVFGCLLDVDADTLGTLAMGREKAVKIVMAQHKEAVSDILRALAASRTSFRATP